MACENQDDLHVVQNVSGEKLSDKLGTLHCAFVGISTCLTLKIQMGQGFVFC